MQRLLERGDWELYTRETFVELELTITPVSVSSTLSLPGLLE